MPDEAGDADVLHAQVERIVIRQIDAEAADHVVDVGARRDVAVGQLLEPWRRRSFRRSRAERARVERGLMHVGIGVDAHVGNRERIVAQFDADAVAEEPAQRCRSA